MVASEMVIDLERWKSMARGAAFRSMSQKRTSQSCSNGSTCAGLRG